MKKLVTAFCLLMIMMEFTGCSQSEKKVGSFNQPEVIFTIEAGKKECVPVLLTVYKDNRYELFTAYKTRPDYEIQNAMLQYSKSRKGTYHYDVTKIIENSVDADSKSYDMNNLPLYEIYVGEERHYYTVEKGQNNSYLNEFLKQIDVDLNVCAQKDYVK